MTDIGYSNLLNRLEGKFITPPAGMTAHELASWLNGYQDCLDDVRALIAELSDRNTP